MDNTSSSFAHSQALQIVLKLPGLTESDIDAAIAHCEDSIPCIIAYLYSIYFDRIQIFLSYLEKAKLAKEKALQDFIIELENNVLNSEKLNEMKLQLEPYLNQKSYFNKIINNSPKGGFNSPKR